MQLPALLLTRRGPCQSLKLRYIKMVWSTPSGYGMIKQIHILGGEGSTYEVQLPAPVLGWTHVRQLVTADDIGTLGGYANLALRALLFLSLSLSC